MIVKKIMKIKHFTLGNRASRSIAYKIHKKGSIIQNIETKHMQLIVPTYIVYSAAYQTSMNMYQVEVWCRFGSKLVQNLDFI